MYDYSGLSPNTHGPGPLRRSERVRAAEPGSSIAFVRGGRVVGDMVQLGAFLQPQSRKVTLRHFSREMDAYICTKPMYEYSEMHYL